MTRKTILFTVLDWGLGHATRSFPLIRKLHKDGHRVIIAGNGPSLQWLENRFENIYCVKKPGKAIRYSKNFNTLKIAQQAPSFLASARDEKVWTEHFVKQENIDLIISDNCYGVNDDHTPSALITHQLNVPVPSILSGTARKIMRRLISGFNEIWVPDVNGMLSGSLSQPDPSGIAQDIGVLSQFDMTPEASNFPLVGMVSGPEPHRTIMHEALIRLFKQDGRPAAILAGRPLGGSETDANVTTFYDADSDRIASLIYGAEKMICRTGYSSLMDLVALKKKAIVIPTPGQPEQEYLADYWQEQFGFQIIEQHNLEKLESIPDVTGTLPPLSINSKAYEVIDRFISSH